MATHSSVLAWRIPGMAEPGGLPSMGSHRVGHEWSDLAAAAAAAVYISEKVMAPHSSTLAWKIPWTEGPGRLQSMGSLGVGHDWATSLLLFTFMHWRRKWQSTPVFLPGESQGRRAWWAAVYGVAQSRIWLKRLSSSSILLLAPSYRWETRHRYIRLWVCRDQLNSDRIRIRIPRAWLYILLTEIFVEIIGES